MNLRQRFLLIFFGLVFLGVVSIGIYSILFLRDYLLATSHDSLDQQARTLSTLLMNQTDEERYPDMIADYARYTGHKVELLDARFRALITSDNVLDSTAALFSGVAPLGDQPTEDRCYVRITASENELEANLREVRYMIFGGTFGALLLTVVVSWIVSERVTFPIRRLAESARLITAGEQTPIPLQERRDEIGDLSRDVAAMATRLQEDIRELQRLNRAQEDFIAALSHEMRNPIFSARGYLEMALDECASEDQLASTDKTRVLDYLQKTHRNLLRIHNLFADMLLLVRLEFDREPIQTVTVDLPILVHELEETFMPRARERGLTFTTQVERDTVQGNHELLKIALSNLLANAIQHSTEGQVRLDITTIKENAVRFQVSDMGEGIPADQLGSIFEKFYRVDKARSRERGGVGLGLALVQRCMLALGTKIQVESEPGKGSRFWFDLVSENHFPVSNPSYMN
jgi:signal transduction histidine kinase